MCDRLPTLVRTLEALAVVGWLGLGQAAADDLLSRYECDVSPSDSPAGWEIYDPCDVPCREAIVDGHFVLRWSDHEDMVNYQLWVAQPPEDPPQTLWVEWRFRSNHPLDPYFFTNDGSFQVRYGGMSETLFMHCDAALSVGAAHFILGLEIDDFHSYRFESLDGVNYRIAVDGQVFVVDAEDNPDGYSFIALGGVGGGTSEGLPVVVNEWDFVRCGTIAYGEQIIGSDPPAGFVDAREHSTLDRFAVTFDSPNYVYIDEVAVAVTGGDAPVVTQTLRRENDGPETVEIVLDRPIPMRETTRFTFDDGVAINEVEYTFALGDIDGDGDADLHDFAAFQCCFGATSLTGTCLALDFNADDTIDPDDYDVFQERFEEP